MAEARLVDGRELSDIARMELLARHAVEGFVSGLHKSPFHGQSVEYADHRPYVFGDEMASIDWRLWAKTDKYYVKLFEDQTNLRATILLDASKSMAFGSKDAEGGMSKFDYGRRLAAMLGYLMLKQNDAVGLALFDQSLRRYIPARSTATHFRVMLETLEQARPDSASGIAAVLHEMAGRLRRRGMVVLISDLLDDPGRVADGLAHFRFRHHDVIVFHLMDPTELTFPYERTSRFRDMEGPGQVVASPRTVRAQYLERLEAFLAESKRNCLERGVGYQFVRTSEPCQTMLRAYLEKRSRSLSARG